MSVANETDAERLARWHREITYFIECCRDQKWKDEAQHALAVTAVEIVFLVGVKTWAEVKQPPYRVHLPLLYRLNGSWKMEVREKTGESATTWSHHIIGLTLLAATQDGVSSAFVEQTVDPMIEHAMLLADKK